MQHTALANSNSTGGTGDRRNLLRCEFTFLHCNRVRCLPPTRMFNFEQFLILVANFLELLRLSDYRED